MVALWSEKYFDHEMTFSIIRLGLGVLKLNGQGWSNGGQNFYLTMT
jgi:hypothetical protein